MKNIVVIGGGTGLSAMLSGMKSIEGAEITAVVTVADDGGSTGRLREAYNIPAIGDVRHVLCAMADNKDNEIFAQLMNYRFEGSADVGGHSLGNLIFLALINITGSYMGAIQAISKVLRVDAKILPSTTLQDLHLYAKMKDGSIVIGESEIPQANNIIDKIYYKRDVTPYIPAVDAVRKADLIIFGIGSLYTSIIPNLIVPGISDAIRANKCPHVYFSNAMTQPGETTGMSMEDHIRAIEKHSFEGAVDIAVIDNHYIPKDVYDRYKAQGAVAVRAKEEEHSYKLLERSLITLDDERKVRHDPEAIKLVVEEIMRSL